MKNIWKALGIGVVCSGVAYAIHKVREMRQMCPEDFDECDCACCGCEAHHMPSREMVDGAGVAHSFCPYANRVESAGCFDKLLGVSQSWESCMKYDSDDCPVHKADVDGRKPEDFCTSFCPYHIEGCLGPEDFDRNLEICPCAGTDSCLKKHTIIDSYDGGYFKDLLSEFSEPAPTSYAEQLGVDADFGEHCGPESEDAGSHAPKPMQHPWSYDQVAAEAMFCAGGCWPSQEADDEGDGDVGSQDNSSEDAEAADAEGAEADSDVEDAEAEQRGGPWSDSDIDLLKTMIGGSKTAEECAIAFGRSVQAVRRKARKLGLVFKEDA